MNESELGAKGLEKYKKLKKRRKAMQGHVELLAATLETGKEGRRRAELSWEAKLCVMVA